MFHTGALLVVSILLLKEQRGSLVAAGWLLVIGTLLFSGSLYVYAPTGIKSLAMITPIGGVVFLIGWIFFGIRVSKLFYCRINRIKMLKIVTVLHNSCIVSSN